MSSANNVQEDSEDNSDDNLEIVIDSPNCKRKISPRPSKSETLVIKSFEDELQRRLDEKAAKSNLNATNVKNIIKHVVTNEHVIALVKNAENPADCDQSIPYEPKLTRAKAKELLSSVPIASMPWKTSNPTSEVHVLFTQDLREDSSGDEYIPGEESEDDRDSSFISDPPSVPPPTPPTPLTNTDKYYIETNWTDDGVFKIPPNKSKEVIEEEANIARRTRSKLSLSSTPLELIEEAFIPPDITTDMYDMDCDNDDWMDFLKKFTRPLDEVAKPTDDEEQDPEYNILADEEIDEIDKEELRVDKAVKVTRKELNDLVAELFESSEVGTNNSISGMDQENKHINGNSNQKNGEVINYSETIKHAIIDISDKTEIVPNPLHIFEEETNISFIRNQIPLLGQQMRQHIQLLTQNFILTYEHPELHSHSIQSREYLMNLKFLCEGKQESMFCQINLMKAIQLVEYWENLLATNNETVKNMKRHIEKTMAECIKQKASGSFYVPTFPQLILETISNSEVFLYPCLLPKIAFKPTTCFSKVAPFIDSEDQLIALGLEQFESLLKRDRHNLTRTGEVKLKLICSFIQEYMMPHRDMLKIFHHIYGLKNPRCGNNPIKYYFQHKKPPPISHFVSPLHELQIVPPCKRLPEHLPYQWQTFIYPNLNIQSVNTAPVPLYNIPTPQVIPAINVNPQISSIVSYVDRPILPHTSTIVFPNRRKIIAPFKRRTIYSRRRRHKLKDPLSKFVECLKRPSIITTLFGYKANYTEYSPASQINSSKDNLLLEPISHAMLPSMPMLGTSLKICTRNDATNEIPKTDKYEENFNVIGNAKTENQKTVLSEISTISSSSFQQENTSTEVEFCRPQTITSTTKRESGFFLTCNKEVSQSDITYVEKIDEPNSTGIEKGLPDCTHKSNAKPPVKKEPSGAEKKRAKLRKEFLANLSVTAPEDPEVEKQKSEMFALAYYDKMRETLELDDYHKIMQILNEHEEGDAVDLYKKIKKVLVPKYRELAEEFLLFLREKEASSVGQLIPWIKMHNRSKFLRKLEIYFRDQPAQLRKIYKCLTELSQSSNVSMEKIKSSLIPMFKGNAVLSDLFLQNFQNERPPPSLLEGPYETIDVAKELSRQDGEEIFETISVPDTEDKYGGPSCICNCHQIEDPEFKSRCRHCILCGTRFINGKVFIQSGKGLRPATVSFITNPTEDHNARLVGKTSLTVTCQRKKRSEISPSKQVILSPSKDNNDEESEDERDGRKKSKRCSPRKKLSGKTLKSKQPSKNMLSKRTGSNKTGRNKYSNGSSTCKEYKPNKKRTYSGKKCKDDKNLENLSMEEINTVKVGVIPGEQKQSTEEPMEWDNNIVSSELKPNSPDQQTAESESEFCEESSQDNCESDSNSSVSSLNNQSQSDITGEECSWKREEDKIILETFQKENDKEYAFKIIANQLKNRTVLQISNRFQTLMTLLLETLGNS